MNAHKIVIHTDVLLDHLCGVEHPSVLRRAMAMFFCYSTVFQAIELFSLARSEKEIRAVEDSLSAMKLLGLNARRARKYGELFASARHMNPLYGLVAGLCLESGLPVLTDRKRDFAGIRGLKVVPARMVRRYGSASEILNAIKR